MIRRHFLACLLPALLASARALSAGMAGARRNVPTETDAMPGGSATASESPLKLFLAGDVMTGRGIDQILAHSSSPEIYESWLRSARQYIEVAERVSGPIPREVSFEYPWGDALEALRAARPSLRIINLETAVTVSDDHWPGKGIHYRMHPENLPVLTAAGIDCCALANNHLLDWGYAGLEETLASLRGAGIATAGAGPDRSSATRPAVLEAGMGRRVLVFSLGHRSSGVGPDWAAGDDKAGVWRFDDMSAQAVADIGEIVEGFKRKGDIAIASLHWGGNWGYFVAPDKRQFARDLLDHAGVDLVHGHSSHHPRGIEIHDGRLILYGCGDFINDYEGIRGYEQFRDDLRVMYLPEIDPTNGTVIAMRMPVFQSYRFSLRRAGDADVAWLADVLNRESRRLGGAGVHAGDGELVLRME